MISAVDLKAGMTIIVDGKLIKVLEASHHKPGKGNTVMRMKLRDVRAGSTVETTFRPDEKFERAYLEDKDVQYLYNADNNAVSYTHLTLPTILRSCRSRWSPYH